MVRTPPPPIIARRAAARPCCRCIRGGLGAVWCLLAASGPSALEGQDHHAGTGEDSTSAAPVSWRMPPMNMAMPMLPGLEGKIPTVAP